MQATMLQLGTLEQRRSNGPPQTSTDPQNPTQNQLRSEARLMGCAFSGSGSIQASAAGRSEEARPQAASEQLSAQGASPRGIALRSPNVAYAARHLFPGPRLLRRSSDTSERAGKSQDKPIGKF